MTISPRNGQVADFPNCRGTLSRCHMLDDLTWMRVGGPADWLFQPTDVNDLVDFLKNLPSSIPVFPMGVGSNLIVRDGGIQGVVIRLGRAFSQVLVENNRIRCGAAALDRQVAATAANAGLDMVFLSTIPGTIGGAVRMNAGCYGFSTGDSLAEASVVMRNGQVRTVSRSELEFGYRKCGLPADSVVIEATFVPQSGNPGSLNERILLQRQRRRATQPQGAGTAGSAFRNPGGRSSYGPNDEDHKPAWRLIDEAGMRGACLGGARISEMHPNFLVNEGSASAADIEGLGEQVRSAVLRHCGVSLDWEIARIGRHEAPIMRASND